MLKKQTIDIFADHPAVMITLGEIGKRIAQLRKQKGFSQEELARQLGIPRPSLALTESGKRNITALELIRLSEALELSIDRLLAKKLAIEPAMTIIPAIQVQKQQERVSIPVLNTDKFRQVLLYILARGAGKPTMGDSVLGKLLYFIEFNHYECYEEHLIGITFRKFPHGPVPVGLDKVLAALEKDGAAKMVKTSLHGAIVKRFLPLCKPDLRRLKASETELIDQVLSQMGDLSSRIIMNLAKSDLPYTATRDGDVIDYELAFYREAPFSVRTYREDQE